MLKLQALYCVNKNNMFDKVILNWIAACEIQFVYKSCVHPHAVCHEYAHTHTLYCSVHGLHKYVRYMTRKITFLLGIPR